MKKLLVSFVFLLAAALAQNSAVEGRWKVHSNISGYESDVECSFTVKDGTLTGACKGEQGSQEITGKVEGSNVTWQQKAEYNGQELTIVYSGKVDSGKLAGTIDVQPLNAAGEFSATKAD